MSLTVSMPEFSPNANKVYIITKTGDTCENACKFNTIHGSYSFRFCRKSMFLIVQY